MRAEAFLLAWKALVDELSALTAEALDVEPLGGVSVAWTARLAALGVVPIAEPQRQPTCADERQTSGAPLPEVREAVRACGARHAAAILRVVTADQRPVAEEGLRRLVQHALEDVEARATAPVKRGLFKHAKAAASRHQSGRASGPQTEVLECPSCRGPRQTEALDCVFCGESLV